MSEILFSESGKAWNTEFSGGVGGRFDLPNSTGKWHGLIIDWMDYYFDRVKDCLLITENKSVANVLSTRFPFDFYTVDLYNEFNVEVDFEADLCNPEDWKQIPPVDSIVSQAALEHVYDPFGAAKNMLVNLKNGGYGILHSHTPGYRYHAYPRDYIRFYPDWFIDLPKFIPNIKLKELVATDGNHIFGLYERRIII